MYIAPNSNVRLLRDVPLDNSYVHSLYWSASSSQLSYFVGKTRHSLSNYSYVSEAKGVIRVGINASQLYECNYLMYQNASYGSKWFYAFITSVEYKNDNMSYVYFEIDSIQTWYFEMNLEQCFIERQHATSDVPGENLVPDNIEKGEYTTSFFYNSTAFGNTSIGVDGSMPPGWSINILSPYDGAGTPANGRAFGNIYSGLYIQQCYSLTEANNVINKLTELNYQDSIVCIYMAPTNFQEPVSGFEPRKETYQVTIPSRDVDGYVPKNNKLFTYPYCFLGVTNYRGNLAEYRYEYFNRREGSIAKFEIAGTDLPNAEFSCAPIGYKGTDGANYNETITLTGLPSCSYATDYYKAWLAQNNSNIQSAAFGLIPVVGASILNPVVGSGILAAKTVGEVANIINEHMQAKAQPDHVHGNQQSSIMYSLGNFNFGFIGFTITYQFARIIDDYWTMYGYPIHRVQRPNLNARKQFTYIKTVGCAIGGSLPNDDRVKIESCFDNGITFWNTPSNVGNYSVDNGVR